MDLYFNTQSFFTRWIVSSGGLRESFVVIDIGVLGGENPRWHLLGDYLVVHGFDASEAAIEDLHRQNAGKSARHYYAIAAGNEDGERLFYFNNANPSSSSFYLQGAGRAGDEERAIPMRRLDTLYAEGVIPQADFLKIDVEGFESDVLEGAQKVSERLLGAEIETSFNVSPTYPDTHFVTMQRMLFRSRLLVFDLNFNRVPRPSYREALSRMAPNTRSDIGRPATVNVFFGRDLIDEADHSENYPTAPPAASVDQIIKTMMICELHGLNDVAYDIAVRFRDRLGERFDVEKGMALLVDPLCRPIVEIGLRHTPALLRRAIRRRLFSAD
jgi:FkbM family methyltransferase